MIMAEEKTQAQPMVTLKIDGQTVTVPKGTNLLEAAESIGIPISYFCYFPGLSSPAVCRQCLVDVKGQPKLVPSCYTPVADNMEVQTATEKVLASRRQMLEFTLVNHPVDCPICDKAGECLLQKLYMEWDGAESRVDLNKVHKPKAVDLGPEIVLDAERCILCTRCIRVCDEVAGTHQLEMSFRGDHEVLGVAPGKRLDHPYSLNTVDVCPVGALTSKDFRFTMRAWELYATPSVCPGCATGCNVEVHHAQGRAWRMVPRHNPEVNKYWMCDEGRDTYKELGERRVVGARHTDDPVPLDKALGHAAERLAKAREEGRAIGVVFGAQTTNEDLYLLGRVVFDILDVQHVYVGGRSAVPERADAILRVADVNPNRAGAKILSRGRAGEVSDLERAIIERRLAALWVVGEDVSLSEAALSALGGVDVIVQAVHENALTGRARVVLPAAAWAEVDGTFTRTSPAPWVSNSHRPPAWNLDGGLPEGHGKLVQRIRRVLDPPGGALPHWELIAGIARKLGVAIELPARVLVLFNEMKAKVPEFTDAQWGRPVPLTQLRFAGSRG
jgi:NADH-quinone oxidoreductase subunit G